MTQASVFTLTENIDRDDDKAPHLGGTVILDQSPYECAAWLGQTRNGDPYVSLSLRPTADRDGQKIQIALWQKKNRTADTDPHFRVNQPVLDIKYSIAATLARDPATALFSLRLEFEPLKAEDLSAEAQARHEQIELAFLQFARPGAPVAPPPPPAKAQSVFARGATPKDFNRGAKPKDPDLDVEPDDIPF